MRQLVFLLLGLAIGNLGIFLFLGGIRPYFSFACIVAVTSLLLIFQPFKDKL
jgi:hypothetical protein